jgi:hypothetical protein
MTEGRGLQDPYSNKATGLNIYDPRVVTQLHRNADTDADKTSAHHTIGPGANQAASGIHTHDGAETRQLGIGITLTGSKGGNAAVASICAALVQILGVTDNTT